MRKLFKFCAGKNVFGIIVMMIIGLVMMGCNSVEYYTKAVEKYPDDPNTYKKLAKAYYDRGMKDYYEDDYDIDQGIADFTEAININPDYEEAYSARGFLYYNEKKEYDKAIEDLIQVIKFDPKDVYTFSLLGSAYNAKGDFPLAIENYSKAIELGTPDYWDLASLHNMRGTVYLKNADYEAAIEDYNQAVKFRRETNDDFYYDLYNSRIADVYRERGLEYFANGNYDAATADYNEAIKITPDMADRIITSYQRHGDAHYENDEYNLAIADYTGLIAMNLGNVHTYYNQRGRSYTELKEYDKAIADYNQFIKMKPNDVAGYHNRAYTYVKKEQFDLAIKDYNEAIKVKPSDKNTYETLLKSTYALYAQKEYERALAYQNNNDPVNAVTYYAKALSLHSDFPVARKAYTSQLEIFFEKAKQDDSAVLNYINARKREYNSLLSKRKLTKADFEKLDDIFIEEYDDADFDNPLFPYAIIVLNPKDEKIITFKKSGNTTINYNGYAYAVPVDGVGDLNARVFDLLIRDKYEDSFTYANDLTLDGFKGFMSSGNVYIFDYELSYDEDEVTFSIDSYDWN